MSALASEAANVAAAENIHLPFEDALQAVEEVAQKTAANHSSMLQDMLRGAPTEIDAICGVIVKIAKKHHISAPVNWMCWQLVKALTNTGCFSSTNLVNFV
jgi:2-dehydropantoate 2-reductase